MDVGGGGEWGVGACFKVSIMVLRYMTPVGNMPAVLLLQRLKHLSLNPD